MSLAWLSLLALLLVGWLCLRIIKRYNTINWGSPVLNFFDGLFRLLCIHYHRLEHQHLTLPETGSAIVASNHVSGLDPFLLIAASSRPLRFMIAREEYERFGLKWLFKAGGCIPVEREKRPERAMREALRALAEGEVVAIFPHGGIHLEDHPPKKLKGGVIRLAQLSDSMIYPVRVTGIAGKGHVVRGVLFRAHAHLETLDLLQADANGVAQGLVGRDDEAGEHGTTPVGDVSDQ